MEKELQQFLRDSNLPEHHQVTIKFLVEAIEQDKINEFVSKTFLFSGNPGIGKTHFVENFVKKLNLPILFLGPFKFEHPSCVQCNSLREIYDRLLKEEEVIVFIDDLQNSFKMEYDGFGEPRVIDKERKIFLSLLEHIKRSDKKKFLFITLNDEDALENSWLDRIETLIELDFPKEKSKRTFLFNKYSKFLKPILIDEIADRTMGYDFRDLEELIKISYREGEGVISRKSLRIALSVYTPPSMMMFKVIHQTNVKFKDILGNDKLKKELSFLRQYIQHPQLFAKNGIERSNLMIFEGPPGTGKTYMAKALAGELDIPMINVNAMHMFGRGGPMAGIGKIVSLARKFKNCIIFVDEFDKLVGHEILGEDRELMGYFEAELDGIREKTKSIVILTMNNKYRFGNALHDRIPCFSFSFPSESDRREYIVNKIKKSEIDFSLNHIDSIVRETSNKSYRQIDKVWNNILFRLMENEKTVIDNNKIIVEAPVLEESIKEVLGIVSNSRPISSMIG